MIELRLCSVEGGKWLDSLPDVSEPVKQPPKNLGLMFDRAVESRLKKARTAAKLRATPVEGFVAAQEGIQFDEELLVSALHAIACAAIVDKTGGADNADVLEAFVRGKHTFSDVPACLRESGVVSCMKAEVARQFGDWIDAVDRNILIEEIRDMHGEDAVETYLAVTEDLRGTLKTATSVHDCDVSSWREPSSHR